MPIRTTPNGLEYFPYTFIAKRHTKGMQVPNDYPFLNELKNRYVDVTADGQTYRTGIFNVCCPICDGHREEWVMDLPPNTDPSVTEIEVSLEVPDLGGV